MSFDPSAPVGEPQPVDENGVAIPTPVETDQTGGHSGEDAPVVDQAGNVQVNPADSEFVDEGVVAPAERPLDPNGDPLVPGTPDEQIVADRVDGPALAVNGDYGNHVEQILDNLDSLIALVGADLSAAVLSEFKHERVAGVTLRIVLDTLEAARRVVGGLDLSGNGAVGVTSGVV